MNQIPLQHGDLPLSAGRTNPDSCCPAAASHESKVERRLGLLDIALRITFFIVGPIPVMLLALHIAVATELAIELWFWDSAYYQQHRWCPFIACLLAGTACFAIRRVKYCGAGFWMGPLIIILGIYILVG